MAVKGLGYTKSTWAFQERPVGSAKLNLWDDRIEAGLELAFFLLSMTWGGDDGVVPGATADDLGTVATSPASRVVKVKPGYAFISRFPFKLGSTTPTAEVGAPTTYPRIDLVQARLAAWDVGVKTGVEAASPAPPSADEDCLAVAKLYLRPGMTSIKDTDDGVNGYIIDARVFL